MIQVVDRLAPMAGTIMQPLEILRQHDVTHRTTFVDTVAAVLAHPGNLSGAARELGIHPNSLRYRLDRIHAVAGIDLNSAPARMRTALGLLLLGPLRERSTRPALSELDEGRPDH
jgi:DNA-binding PucR family transcriptional regulator